MGPTKDRGEREGNWVISYGHEMENFCCCGTQQPPQPAFRGPQTMFVSAFFTVLAPTDSASKFNGQFGQDVTETASQPNPDIYHDQPF